MSKKVVLRKSFIEGVPFFSIAWFGAHCVFIWLCSVITNSWMVKNFQEWNTSTWCLCFKVSIFKAHILTFGKRLPCWHWDLSDRKNQPLYFVSIEITLSTCNFFILENGTLFPNNEQLDGGFSPCHLMLVPFTSYHMEAETEICFFYRQESEVSKT